MWPTPCQQWKSQWVGGMRWLCAERGSHIPCIHWWILFESVGRGHDVEVYWGKQSYTCYRLMDSPHKGQGVWKMWLRIKMCLFHYSDIIMCTIASQITSLTIVYSTVYSDADQSKHQSSASLAFVRGIHRGLVNSPHKWPVTRKKFPFDDVIMLKCICFRRVWKYGVASLSLFIFMVGWVGAYYKYLMLWVRTPYEYI